MNQPRKSTGGYRSHIAGAIAYANGLASATPLAAWGLYLTCSTVLTSHDGTKLLSVPIIPPHRAELPMKRSANKAEGGYRSRRRASDNVLCLSRSCTAGTSSRLLMIRYESCCSPCSTKIITIAYFSHGSMHAGPCSSSRNDDLHEDATAAEVHDQPQHPAGTA